MPLPNKVNDRRFIKLEKAEGEIDFTWQSDISNDRSFVNFEKALS